LRPLNLATVWTTAVPIISRQDGIGIVQVVDDKQVFVQTRAGVLVALDAATGSQQWAIRYDTPFSPLVPIAVNDRFVFAVNVIKLHCLHRYTGVVEFTYNLPLSPQAAPNVDDNKIYVTVGAGRLMALELPPPLQMPDPELTRRTAFGLQTNDQRSLNPADAVARRYPPTGRRTYFPDEEFESPRLRLGTGEPGAGLATLQRTPSISVLPTVLPPYRLFDENGRYLTRIESLNTVHSMRQPYSLQDPTAGTSQRTPSIAVIPPSVAAVYEMISLLPRGVEPALKWIYGSTVRLVGTPLVTRQRVWSVTAAPRLIAILKEDKAPQIDATITSIPSASAAQAEDIGYIPLSDGNLLAVRLDAGGAQTIQLVWRANIGGLMDKEPVPTWESVYVAGQNSGITRVDRQTGEVIWRTPTSSDTLLAVNRQYAYVWDRAGRLQVFDRLRPSNVSTRQSLPLMSVPFPSFNVPVTNGKTDRILLAADNGLIVCLRDATPQYARPYLVSPPIHAVEQLPAKPTDQKIPGDDPADPDTQRE
jgi:outer membrane protein assembly factor BamB